MEIIDGEWVDENSETKPTHKMELKDLKLKKNGCNLASKLIYHSNF